MQNCFLRVIAFEQISSQWQVFYNVVLRSYSDFDNGVINERCIKGFPGLRMDM